MEEYIKQQMSDKNSSSKDSSKNNGSNSDGKDTAASIKDEESRLYQELANQVKETSDAVRAQQDSSMDPDQGSSSVLVGGNTGIAEVSLPPSMRTSGGDNNSNGNNNSGSRNNSNSNNQTGYRRQPLRRDGAGKKDDLRLRRHRFGKSEKSSSAMPSLTSDTTKPLDMSTGSLLPTKFNATSSGVAQSRGMTNGSRSATAEQQRQQEMARMARAEAAAEAAQSANVDDDRVGFQGMMAKNKGSASSNHNSNDGKSGGRDGNDQRKGGFRRRQTRDDQVFRKFVKKQFGKR
mmetsp:Transcript_13031/g.37732  ORF Transcript_13031/g.37732 Transcript_13031/m.37732 type:complete len:290 (-) Transcript_13031:185-1054(-)